MDVWEVPEKYICDHAKIGKNSPCWQDSEVICWVARPKEKTILVKYMLVMQLLSIFLTTLELAVFSCKWSMRLHLPERQRPDFSRKVVSMHRYLVYDTVRHRPTKKSSTWKSSEPYTEDLLIPSTPVHRRRFFRIGPNFCTKFDPLNIFFKRRASYHFKG